jgi:hypothetical protein
MKSATKVKVVQNDIDPIPVEILAASIRSIAVSVRRIEASGLQRRALALLLADSSRCSMSVVLQVLRAMDTLERDFISKPPSKQRTT